MARPDRADAGLEFKKLARSIAVQVQKVAANTAAVTKFVDLLGSSKDNPSLRTRLCVPARLVARTRPGLDLEPRRDRHDLTESTREVLKGSTTDVKRLNDWKLQPDDVRSSLSLPVRRPTLFNSLTPLPLGLLRHAPQRHHRQEQQKVSADFQRALEAFQQVSRRSAERQRLFVERQRATVEAADAVPLPCVRNPSGVFAELSWRGHRGLTRRVGPLVQERRRRVGPAARAVSFTSSLHTSHPLPRTDAPLNPRPRRQPQEQQLADADVDFQEQLIEEREGEIEQIEQGITELNQIFKDLGQIVGEQQSMIGASLAARGPPSRSGACPPSVQSSPGAPSRCRCRRRQRSPEH